MSHAHNFRNEMVRITLSQHERTLILDDLPIFDFHLLRPISSVVGNPPIEMPVEDVDGLCVYLEYELRRGYIREHGAEVQRLLQRLRQVVVEHSSEDVASPTEVSADPQPAFPVSYSQAQRRAIADCVPELAGRLRLNERNARVVELTVGEMRLIKRQSRRAVCTADNGMRRNSLDKVIDATCRALDKYAEGSILRIRPTERLYQFRVSLMEIRPEIWRRIQVKECTLDRLHEHIQLAFGWWNYHLYKFQVGQVFYGDPWLLSDPVDRWDFEDSTQVPLCDIVPKDGQRLRFRYQYDFGDGWEHEVLFEGCLRSEKGQRYPICLEGERACPPEDVGGVGGYYEYLEAMADPEHEDHKDLMAWRGPYDPEAFDARETTKKMRRGMPKPADEGW